MLADLRVPVRQRIAESEDRLHGIAEQNGPERAACMINDAMLTLRTILVLIDNQAVICCGQHIIDMTTAQ